MAIHIPVRHFDRRGSEHFPNRLTYKVSVYAVSEYACGGYVYSECVWCEYTSLYAVRIPLCDCYVIAM